MAKQTINIGASPNDGTGTPLRTSFDYTNQNFTELYTALGGGVGLPGATTQVIFNDGGTNLAGDAGLVYNKTTDALTVAGLVTAGSAAITGDLTVDTSTLKVDSTNNRVGIGTVSPAQPLHVRFDNAGTATVALFENQLTDFSVSTAGQIAVGSRGYNYTVLRQNPDGGASPSIGGNLDTVLANISALGAGYGKLILATQNTARLSVHETSGDVSIANGNVVMATSGKGIDFSATTGTGTSELLNDYEEGTWSPTPAGGSNLTSQVSVSARYTKVGRLVTLSGYLTATVTLPNIDTYFVLPTLPFANGTVTTGSLIENGGFKVGVSQVSASNLYGFFPAASAITAGAKDFYYSITYSV